MIAGLLGLVLVLFQIVLIARVVVDWIGMASRNGASNVSYQAARITYGITEPVIAPVRRFLKPVQIGSVSVDLALAAVFLAVILARVLVVPLIPF